MTDITVAGSTARSARRTAVVLAWVLVAGFTALPALRALFVLGNDVADITYPTAADVPTLEPQAVFGGLVFILLGAALIALVIAVRSWGRPSPVARAGLIAGVTAGTGLVFAGIQAREQYSWISANLAEAAPDPDAQAAALWALNIVSSAGLDLGALGVAAWAILSAIDGSVLGRGWGWAAAAIAVVLAAVMWGFALPAAQYLYVPFFAVVAIGLTVASRRVAQSPQRG